MLFETACRVFRLRRKPPYGFVSASLDESSRVGEKPDTLQIFTEK
jgi:hypothetical protein